jgi:cell surface protein SprA
VVISTTAIRPTTNRSSLSRKPSRGRANGSRYPKELNFNYLPQNLTFNTDMTRTYYELQERDLDNLENPTALPLVFSEQFLWNREFSLRWDFTKSLHASFTSATNAEIEEPYTPVNKDLYPDHYHAWKDSVWHSIKHMGRPLDYSQTFNASYQLPLNKIPCFDWTDANVTYASNYSWTRGTDLEDGTSLGNTVTTQRTVNATGRLNFETLYNHVPFLKEANSAAKKTNQPGMRTKKTVDKTSKNTKDDKNAKDGKDSKNGKPDAGGKNGAANDKGAKGAQPNSDNRAMANAKNAKVKGFSKEVMPQERHHAHRGSQPEVETHQGERHHKDRQDL